MSKSQTRITEDMITEDMIRNRAHHIWEREGRPDGRADGHWHLACAELASEMSHLDTGRASPRRRTVASAKRPSKTK
ncbi:MAG: DUF2934 domain-containing protein [Magnetospirillum sp.]|nr:DUF2934 domain-containing protein [Magnetospirillum sp.]